MSDRDPNKTYCGEVDCEGMPGCPCRKDKDIRVIYQGGYIPDLAIDFTLSSDYYGWLYFKHPDGQWVTLADLRGTFSEHHQALEQVNNIFMTSKRKLINTLTEEKKALEKENKDLLNACEMKQECINANKSLAGDNIRLREALEEARKVINMYGGQWHFATESGWSPTAKLWVDHGKRARKWQKNNSK